jgi:hypothetical protein
MRPFITMAVCSTLAFSQAVQSVESSGGETYSGDLFSPVIGAAVPLLSTLGAKAIFLPTKNIIGTAGFINAEETTGYDPSERDHGRTFLTEWHIGYTLAGLPGKSTVGFVLLPVEAVFTPWQYVTADVHYIDSALH